MKIFLIVITLVVLICPVHAATIGTKPASTSDDWGGENAEVTYNGAWLVAADSTYPGAGQATLLGWDGSWGSYAHSTTFALAIPQGSTIDSAEYLVRSGCNACTDSLRLLASILDADIGVQIVDTAGFRLRFSQRAVGILDLDTGYLSTATPWALAAYVRLPFNKLKGVIQNAVSRAGYGGSVTIFITDLDQNASTLSRATRSFSYSSGTTYDSLWVQYTAPTGSPRGTHVMNRKPQ